MKFVDDDDDDDFNFNSFTVFFSVIMLRRHVSDVCDCSGVRDDFNRSFYLVFCTCSKVICALSFRLQICYFFLKPELLKLDWGRKLRPNFEPV